MFFPVDIGNFEENVAVGIKSQYYFETIQRMLIDFLFRLGQN